MTKPLAFVLQLGGAIVGLVGLASSSTFMALIGLGMVIAGGIGIRKRIR